jgi:hypothetical protein
MQYSQRRDVRCAKIPSEGITVRDPRVTTLGKGVWARLALVTVAAVLAVTGLATPAHAATTPPSVDKKVSNHGTGSTGVSVTTTGSRLLVAYVSADGPSSAQTATVSVGGTNWNLVTSHSYQSSAFAPGYSGIFSTGSNVSAGTRTVTVNLGSSTNFNVFLVVVAYTNASGIGGSASDSANAGCPNIPVTATGSNAVYWWVGHDWTNATTPVAWDSAQTVDAYWLDPNGDTTWVGHRFNPSTTANEIQSMALSSPCDDQFNLSGVTIEGV